MTAVDEAALAALKAEIEEWVRGPAEDWAAVLEETGDVPRELFEEIRAKGFFSLAAPPELGGRGIPFAQYLELMEIFSRAHGSIRMLVHVVNGTWRAIEPFATPEQKEQFLKPSVSAEKLIAFTLTEAEAGTGADIRSSVRREGDTYYLSGEKHLITFGVKCDWWLLAARL